MSGSAGPRKEMPRAGQVLFRGPERSPNSCLPISGAGKPSAHRAIGTSAQGCLHAPHPDPTHVLPPVSTHTFPSKKLVPSFPSQEIPTPLMRSGIEHQCNHLSNYTANALITFFSPRSRTQSRIIHLVLSSLKVKVLVAQFSSVTQCV